MNKTVTLVNEWGNFESAHPNGSLEEFCRHFLARQQQKKISGTLVGGIVPDILDGLLLKIMGRIQRLNLNYANMALKGTGLNQIEEFGVLLTVKLQKNPKKTEVIYANLFELSSGTDMLNRMKKRGLIKEYDDKQDKRSKRIEITAKGEKVVNECKNRIVKNATMLMHDLTDDDKKICIQLLKKVEIKFSALWPKHKGREFEEVYKEVMGDSDQSTAFL